jgi:hypothetical protein
MGPEPRYTREQILQYFTQGDVRPPLLREASRLETILCAQLCGLQTRDNWELYMRRLRNEARDAGRKDFAAAGLNPDAYTYAFSNAATNRYISILKRELEDLGEPL